MARKLTQKEQNEVTFTPLRPKDEVSRWERFTDFWSEFRWLVILGIAVFLIIIYLIVSITSQTPDLTLCVITTDKTASDTLGPRLVAELTPYSMDMNGDGKVLIHVEYYTLGASGKPSEAFEQDIAGGKKFLVLSDPGATQYLTEHNYVEPMTTFSDVLPASAIGARIDQLGIFEKDLALYDDLDGWTMLMRSYTSEGLNKVKETKTEVNSALYFYARILTDWTAEIPVE